MSTHVVALACPGCEAALGPEVDSVAFCCGSCGQTWRVGRTRLERLPVIWSATGDGRPWWRLPGQAHIVARDTFGASDGPSDRWQRLPALWVPAWERDIKQALDWAFQQSIQTEQPAPGTQAPGARHVPCVVGADDAIAIARILVVHAETRRGDDLRRIEVELDVGTPELWILP